MVALAPRMWVQGDAPRRPHMVADWLFGNWLWWDGGWYTQIAQHGYTFHPHQQSSVAFFPAYPAVVRAVSAVTPGGIPVAAVIVTMLCGLAAFVAFHRWCRAHISATASLWALIAMAVYPYAWFLYGAAYADALFLAATIGAFVLVEHNRPVAAGLLGVVATAARPTGVIVLVGLAAVVLSRRPITRRDLGVLLAGVGIGTWCVWLALRFGHPFAFIETEGAHGWDRSPGWPTWLKFSFVDHLTRDPIHVWLPLVIQAAMCVAFLAAVPAVYRRFGRAYAVYVTVAVLVPMISTDDFMGTGRYLLAAFPVFAIVGERLDSARRAQWPYVTVSCAALVIGMSLFATGHLMA